MLAQLVGAALGLAIHNALEPRLHPRGHPNVIAVSGELADTDSVATPRN